MKSGLRHCEYCGHAFDASVAFPASCQQCASITYLNPKPIGLVLLPVDRGVVVIRRSGEKKAGQLAFPGGFIEQGESWQEGAARELWEETGIRIDADEIKPFDIRSTPNGKLILIFGLAKGRKGADLPAYVPTSETTERLILQESQELAFPIHTAVLARFFQANKGLSLNPP